MEYSNSGTDFGNLGSHKKPRTERMEGTQEERPERICD